jgi:SNF2 family DNA or RNA helicase
MRLRSRKYKFRTKPWRHQVRALEKLLRAKPKEGGALFMAVGTGKTKVYIDFACAMELKRGVKRALVLSTKSVVEGVWPRELRIHVPEESQVEFRLVNYEAIIDRDYEDGSWTDNLRGYLEWCNEEPTVLILDEAHKVKGKGTSKTGRACYQLGKVCRAVVVGTGTPIGKWHLDLFNLYKIIDEGILGTTWSHFKKFYAVWGGYGGYQLIRPRNRKRLLRAIKPWTFRIRKDQCLDLPPVVHESIEVALSSSREAYDEMARESYLELQGGEFVADNPLVRIRRLSQLTSGFIRSEEGGIHWVGREKATRLYWLLRELRESGRKKVVVFCNELPELRLAGLVSRKAGFRPIYFHGGTTSREAVIAEFEEESEPVVFAAQIRTGTEGIDLTAASEGIVFSEPDSLITHEQLEGRFHRASQKWRRAPNGEWEHQGKKLNRVTIYHLLAKDTYDEVKFVAMQKKIDLAKAVLDHPELLYQGQSIT